VQSDYTIVKGMTNAFEGKYISPSFSFDNDGETIRSILKTYGIIIFHIAQDFKEVQGIQFSCWER
jgi:hypothetical protein